MKRPIAAAAFGALVVVAGADARAATPTPFDGIGETTILSFSGTNVFLVGGAVLTTGAMAQSGIDHSVRVAVQNHLRAPAYGDAAFYAGYFVPAITAPAFYVTGLVAGNDDAANAGAAALQALGITLATTGILKWATGRAYPLNGGDPHAPDRLQHPSYARTFTPFDGPLLAWPSGHTSSMVALVAALTAYAPDRLVVPLVGYPLAAGVGFGMIVGDRHWTSDVLAGALLGQAIGFTVGTQFRARAHGSPPPRLQLGPTGPGTFGVSGAF